MDCARKLHSRIKIVKKSKFLTASYRIKLSSCLRLADTCAFCEFACPLKLKKIFFFLKAEYRECDTATQLWGSHTLYSLSSKCVLSARKLCGVLRFCLA